MNPAPWEILQACLGRLMTSYSLSGMVFTIVFSCPYSTFLKKRISIFDFWLQSLVIKTHRQIPCFVLLIQSPIHKFSSSQLSSQFRTDFFIKKILKMEEVDFFFCEMSYFLSFRFFYHQVFVLFLVKVTEHVRVTWYFFPWYTLGFTYEINFFTD